MKQSCELEDEAKRSGSEFMGHEEIRQMTGCKLERHPGSDWNEIKFIPIRQESTSINVGVGDNGVWQKILFNHQRKLKRTDICKTCP